jgi:ribosomal protein S18 acetylase RimI-like enzyme
MNSLVQGDGMRRWPVDELWLKYERKVLRFEPGMEHDFWALHSAEHGCGWCFCSAWWVPEWEGWAERTAEQNRAVREELLEKGEYDGYLLYRGGQPIGWCQVGPRDRLTKLCEQFGLNPDPEAWAITCFLIHPAYRRRGFARSLLRAVLDDLPARGARRVEAYPRRGPDLDPLDLWDGTESLFLEAGFEVIQEDPVRPVLGLELRR